MSEQVKKAPLQRAKILEVVPVLVPQDAKGNEKYPILMDCLLPRWVEGVCVRQSGSLRVRIVGSCFLVTLECPTEGVTATATLDTVVGLAEQMERFLASGRANWEESYDRRKKARQAKV